MPLLLFAYLMASEVHKLSVLGGVSKFFEIPPYFLANFSKFYNVSHSEGGKFSMPK